MSAEDDRPSKLILEKVRSFDEIPREVWLQFTDRAEYGQEEAELQETSEKRTGVTSAVVIFLKDVKAMKRLPAAVSGGDQDETSLRELRTKIWGI